MCVRARWRFVRGAPRVRIGSERIGSLLLPSLRNCISYHCRSCLSPEGSGFPLRILCVLGLGCLPFLLQSLVSFSQIVISSILYRWLCVQLLDWNVLLVIDFQLKSCRLYSLPRTPLASILIAGQELPSAAVCQEDGSAVACAPSPPRFAASCYCALPIGALPSWFTPLPVFLFLSAAQWRSLRPGNSADERGKRLTL